MVLYSGGSTNRESQVNVWNKDRFIFCNFYFKYSFFLFHRSIEIKSIIDTHTVAFFSRSDVAAVACGRHSNRIYVFDIDERHSKWHLNPQMVNILPKSVHSI